MVGQRVFSERRADGGHELVADLDACGVGAEGRDFARFYAEVKRLASLPRAERDTTLARL